MTPVEILINGHLFTFTKHFQMGIAYYNVATTLIQITLIPSYNPWTFLHPDKVPPEIPEIKDQLASTIESLKK